MLFMYEIKSTLTDGVLSDNTNSNLIISPWRGEGAPQKSRLQHTSLTFTSLVGLWSWTLQIESKLHMWRPELLKNSSCKVGPI